MKIALVQTTIIWEDKKSNILHFDKILATVDKNVDIIVFPEMFTTGFTMHPSNVAETMEGITVNWMKEVAVTKNCAIVGSLVIEEQGGYFNRFLFIFPNGTIEYYDKRHLFTLAGEEKVYTPNLKTKTIIHYKDWKICPLICYDLRFPVFSRNTVEYDALIYVANWPAARRYAWQNLLKARAIENQSYVIACNRIGSDGNGVDHQGDSAIVNYLGEEIGFSNDDKVFQFNLNKASLLQYRSEFPVLADRDDFELK